MANGGWYLPLQNLAAARGEGLRPDLEAAFRNQRRVQGANVVDLPAKQHSAGPRQVVTAEELEHAGVVPLRPRRPDDADSGNTRPAAAK